MGHLKMLKTVSSQAALVGAFYVRNAQERNEQSNGGERNFLWIPKLTILRKARYSKRPALDTH